MAKFTVTIKTDNAAFDPDPGREVATILRNIATRVEQGMTAGNYFTKPISDTNGNTVGKFIYTK